MANTHGQAQQRAQCPFSECPFREQIQQHAEELEGHGETIDHIMNTLDTIVIPTQKVHAESIARHERVTEEATQFMAAWSGAWVLVQRVGIVLAAAASVATCIMKALGK